MSDKAFSSLPLRPELIENLRSLDYTSTTPIQAQSLPLVLAGRDVIAQAKTGSGKTAAFGLGLLNRLDVKLFRVQSLVLCPTRELADQVAVEIRRLARAIHNIKVLTLCGGTAFGPQLGSLEHGAHIIVGTPGRVEEHLRKGSLKAKHISSFVLDEADRMLDMGFEETLNKIVDWLPAKRQTLLFSATYPDAIESMAKRVLRDPAMVKVDSSHDEQTIPQHFYRVDSNEQRREALRLLLLEQQPESAVVFCNTRQEVKTVDEQLRGWGFSVLALHGDLEQRERDEMLVRFANKSTTVLVATDVAARGLDIDKVALVVNYQVAHDPEVHVHRVGRTGRAGSSGLALTLFSDREAHKLAALNVDVDPITDALPLPGRAALQKEPPTPPMVTFQIDGGKKQKLRPGDILGALTGEGGIDGKAVGKIQIFDNRSYLAVAQKDAKRAFKKLSEGKLKGRRFRLRRIA
ncbi:ATP-dependent RNA helicase DbpA [Spongiibacter nanhainus]|uniref:ATP-dependent RNA helicase DbpA n=1 Tax=Spongiibacter nanhainus TaxID=2794344 RepID=A0A7T4R1N8_9GAMM|nr:ATP-dependent RNA helicase DbpA [Spongiibacter nanhainus]QQD18806.1 ATP-dependent RNA helicase DbpA [Spongiibacter nanhainus]